MSLSWLGGCRSRLQVGLEAHLSGRDEIFRLWFLAESMFDDHLYAVPDYNIHSSLCHLGVTHQGATSALQLLLGLPERQRATTLQLLLALPLSKKG